MTNITPNEYTQEIESIVDNIINELIEEGDSNDLDSLQDNFTDRLHETIDGHEWVIYYSNNLPVLQASKQPLELGIENGLIDANHIIKESGVLSLFTSMAYCAMEEDCNDYFSTIAEAVEFPENVEDDEENEEVK